MTTPGIAANAYAQLARVTEGAGNLAKTIGDGTERNGPDFAAVLKQALALLVEERHVLQLADRFELVLDEKMRTAYRKHRITVQQFRLEAGPFTSAISDDDILIFGRESAGAPQAVHEAAEARIVIPMREGLRSLNVALAAAMIAGEALRQTGRLPAPPLRATAGAAPA